MNWTELQTLYKNMIRLEGWRQSQITKQEEPNDITLNQIRENIRILEAEQESRIDKKVN